MEKLKESAKRFIDEVNTFESKQNALRATKGQLEESIKDTVANTEKASNDLEIATNALKILRSISDDAVTQSYRFIEDSINSALERIFERTQRRIRLKETTRGGIHPQLEIELLVENNVVRSLKDDSGHGIMQIISLLCILTLIVITGGRRILLLDEILSGISATSRKIVDDILWSFVDIGFQFIVSEHGYVPRGSKVYELEMVGGISGIKREYVSDGVYLDKPIVTKHILSRLANISDTDNESEKIIEGNTVHDANIIDI